MNTRTDHRDLGLEPGPDPRLRDDIRLLGRLLGDNVREQEGDEIYELVETIRQTSVRFHRDGEEAARHELETILAKLTPVQSFQIVRAYSYFSHLSNIAEDQQLIRNLRQQAMAGLSPQPGTLARAFERAREAGLGPVELRRFVESAFMSLVLTAHPTEVRRKSTMTRELAIAGLLDKRDRIVLSHREERELEDKLRRAMLLLWQTSLLRRTRLTVADEVANGLSYYDYTFLSEVPLLYQDVERLLQDHAAADSSISPTIRKSPPFSGSAAGSAATATAIPSSTSDVVLRQSPKCMAHASSNTMTSCSKLAEELSISTEIVPVSKTYMRWRECRLIPRRTGSPSPTGGRFLPFARGSRRRSPGSTPSIRAGRRRRRCPPIPMHPSLHEISISSIARCRDNSARAARTPQELAPRGRLFRLSSCEPRFAPEFRRPRAHDRRDVRAAAPAIIIRP